MAKMNKLSLTESVRKAFDDRYELLGPFDDNWQELCLAAAIRAAVDQVIPIQYEILDNCWYEKSNPVRDEFLKIATELEVHD